MKTIFTILIIAASTLFICSISNEPSEVVMDKHQLLFAGASDILKNYQDVEVVKEMIATDSTISDFIKLDFKQFKHKYVLSDYDMDQLAAHIKITCSIVEAFRAVESNTEQTQSLTNQNYSSNGTADYNFDSNLASDSSIITDNESMEMIKAASDVKIEPIK
jgi:hypothetical protein